MPQISKGDTFADTQQLTATRLNQLVDSATILVGAISEQTAITANTLEATDTTIVNDGGVLRKATIGDFFGSGMPIVSKTINSTATNDVTITPFDGTIVAGSTYVCTNGLNVTVTTLAAHGLAVNNTVLISAAGTGYNGTFRVTAVTTLTFQFVLFTAATATPTATACNYTRKATVIENGNDVVSGNQFVNGTIRTPNLEVETSNINTSTSKTNNVTTAMQYSGVPVYGISSVTQSTIPYAFCSAETEALRTTTCGTWRTAFSIPSQTKTNKEIWVMEFDFPALYLCIFSTRFRLMQVGTSTVHSMQYSNIQYPSQYFTTQIKLNAIIPVDTVFTNETFNLEFIYNASYASSGAVLHIGYNGGTINDSTVTSKVTITKYVKP